MPRSSFQPNLDKIESFRIKRGWTIDDLAAKAVCSPRTINSLKKGNRVQIKTVRKIAKAFGVSFESLLIGYVETPNEKGPRVTIRIELGIPFGSFTSSAKMEFRDLLIALLQSTDGINVTSVVAGSTIITLDMSARDAFRLIYLARATRDHDLGIEHDTEGLILSLLKSTAGKHIKVSGKEGKRMCKSFQVVTGSKLLQKQPATKGDLRKYDILSVACVLPLKASATHGDVTSQSQRSREPRISRGVR